MPERNIAVVILVTAPDGQVAAEIARRLLEERLVACANIVPGLRSLYRWEGEVQDDSEVLMLLKGREQDVEVIAERVQELHPYSVPEVVATEIVAGLDAYLDWIRAETERNDA
jgi:periplasmic divalent cation tolerance protein